MTKIKQFSQEDLDICRISMLDMVNIDGEEGKTSLPGQAGDYAEYYRLLHLFSEQLGKRDYREMVQKPIFNKKGMNITPNRSWQKAWLVFIPSFIKTVYHLTSEKYLLSIEVEIFRSVCEDHSVFVDDALFNEFCRDPNKFYYVFPNEYERYRSFTNFLMHAYHERLAAPRTRRKILDRRRAVEKLYKESEKYLGELVSQHARLDVIRVDVAYKKGLDVSVEQLAEDINRMYGNKRHNQIFDHYLGGYIKIEYGLEKGVHAHLILIFDGSKRNPNSDAYLGQQIGEYWSQKITEGNGRYWNCNSKEYKQMYERTNQLGIGDIHYEDKEKIANLCRIIRYFCKSEQFIKPRTKLKMKLFRKGQIPKKIGLKRGAPRASQRKGKLLPGIGEGRAVSMESSFNQCDISNQGCRNIDANIKPFNDSISSGHIPQQTSRPNSQQIDLRI